MIPAMLQPASQTALPLVSVIIPTYNYGRFVTEAVDSALSQTYEKREVIVVDDGSTDDTRQILKPLLDRIVYIHQVNQGLSAARNTGIKAAQGKLIALLDSDDVWHPRKLEVQVEYLLQHPEVDLVASEHFTDQRSEWPALHNANLSPTIYTLEDVLGTAHFAPSAALIRRTCLDEVGLFDVSLRCVEDRDMWVRLASRHRLAKLPLPLLWYRLHPQSLSNKAATMEATELRVLDKAFRQIPALQRRWLLKRRTYGQAAMVSAQQFRANGYPAIALGRVLRSLLWWPFPLERRANDIRFLRLKVFVNLLLSILRLRAPAPAAGTTGGASPPKSLAEKEECCCGTT
jgi:glycosyltransferase involved in cell wall biosynthesis